MGCASCGTSVDGKPKGCKSNGGCSSGGCNKLNTFDWLAKMEVSDYEEFDIVEVSFKNGSRKQFFQNPPHVRAIIGDNVVVESASGYDVGRISLTGELVRLQMKKKRVSPDSIFPKIIRLANERDYEKLEEARSMERHAMIRARAIARSLGLEMKLGDVEFQGDRRKATFYYTADGRVDFRELIRHYAKEFRVKIEMRQIGARQESSRIGGLGSCGRELCCSTWLTNFKSVTTGAARYQNLAINQSKLSGQCGRLKCCLNYELDTYMDALQDFPKHPERLETEAGVAILMKTDIFKRLMVYTYSKPGKRGAFYTLSVDRVKTILQMNAEGEKPMELVDTTLNLGDDDVVLDFGDVTGAVELPPERRSKRRSRGGFKRGDRNREDRASRGRGDRKEDKRDGRPEKGANKDGKKRGRFERNTNKEDKREGRSDRGANRDDKRKSRFERNDNKGDKRGRRPERGSNRDDKRGDRPERGNNKDGKRDGRSEKDATSRERRGSRPERGANKDNKRGSRPERDSNKDNKRGSRFERDGNKDDRRGSRRPERGANKEDARGNKDRREDNGKDRGGEKSKSNRFGKGRDNRYRDNRKSQEGDSPKKSDRDSSKDSNNDKQD